MNTLELEIKFNNEIIKLHREILALKNYQIKLLTHIKITNEDLLTVTNKVIKLETSHD